MSSSSRPPFVLPIVVALLLLVGLLGSRMLNADLLFTDEYLSLRTAGSVDGPLTPTGVIQRILKDDIGGMGAMYYLQLHFWEDATGTSPFTARVFSWLFGILAVAWLYRLGTELFNAKIGLYASVLLATSAFFIDYTHEARAYTQFAFVMMLVFWLYWHIQKTPHASWRWYVALIVSVAWLVYTHYIALVLGAVIALYHVLRFANTRHWWQTFIALSIGGATYLAWLGATIAVLQIGLGDTNRHNDSMAWTQFVPLLIFVFANANVALFVFVGWYAVHSPLRRTPPPPHTTRLRALQSVFAEPLFFLILWFVVAMILVIVINARIPFMVNIRYLLFLFPPLALWMALGIERASQTGISAVLILVVWGVVGVGQVFNPTFINTLFGQIYRAPAQGVYQAMDSVRQRATDQDVLLFHLIPPKYETFLFFPMAYLLQDVHVKRADQFEMMNLSFKRGDNDYLKEVETVFEGASFVWTVVVPDIPTTNKSDVVNYALSTQFAQCEQILQRPDVDARLYARVPLDQPADDTFVTPDNQALNLYAFKVAQYGDHLRVILGWDADTIPQGTYSYAVQLVDADGTVVAHSDNGVPDVRPFGCTSSAFDMTAVPSGNYTVKVVVYNWQTLAPLVSSQKTDVIVGQIARP